MTALPAVESTLMFREAHSSAGLIAAQFAANAGAVARLAARLRAQPPRFIVTCARGSSDHAATFAKYLFETQLGLSTASASPSVTSVYAAPLQLDGALFVAISQSGKSPDLVRSAEAARTAGAQVLALVNTEDSPLAAVAHDVIALRAGPERSVAATKSYLCTLAALLQLATAWSARRELADALDGVPAALTRSWDSDWSALVDALAPARNLFVLGRGLGLGAAQEAALKFKETSGLHAEAFSAAEVRHGPMALIGEGFPLLVFAQDDGTQAGTLAAAQEFRARGARVFVAAPGDPAGSDLPLPERVHPAVAPLLQVQSFYRACNALALRRGHNPDLPPHLNKVTETV
ncbi:MAG: iron dicitrate transport regulator FecR [Lysobacterales bacterium 69-70]|nr:SIS domain-containing protein [Xanthomonadaceae bacterium]ODU30841.1 MAG: iron dicitrate transport regulator FecR [Xanthomonadaceae bacterium SCN 69-320]ODV22169.1 MAG: iron dicitrate transport regulator FecR [Xanthomonadaceae bacterium SCN 69-25]OJY98430.1 MAG: iron dicitrate transport regulator FecR [Xanthomonadales bacterium 69-70]